MNWLAHVLLSRDEIDHRLGNLLADPLKGRGWKGASAALREGMALHRFIDKYTDRHAVVQRAKGRLGPRGHLRGVVIDLLFDHWLTRRWDAHVHTPMAEFLRRFETDARARAESMPVPARDFVQRVTDSGVLSSYGDMGGLEQALLRIDRRVSERVRRRESAHAHLPQIEQNYRALGADFSEFFPQLVAQFKAHPLGSPDNHSLRES